MREGGSEGVKGGEGGEGGSHHGNEAMWNIRCRMTYLTCF